MTLSYFKQANKLKQQGKLEEAIASYHQAVEQNPNFYCYHHNLGETVTKLGRLDEAVTYYRRAIEINPKSTWSYYNLGVILAKLGREHEAILAYRKTIEIYPNSHIFYKHLGKTFYELAIQQNPESLDSWNQIKNILSIPSQNDSFTAKLYCLEDATFLQTTSQLNNENFLEEVYRVYLQRQADEGGKNIYLQEFSNGKTREDIITAIRESPEFGSKFSFSIKSTCFQQAVIAYRRAIELSANTDRLYQSLGKMLTNWGKILEQEGQLEQAIEIYQEAIAASHNQAEAHYNQANLLVQQGLIEAAADSYKKAIAIKPDWVEAYINLGDILIKLKHPGEAVTWLNQAVSYISSEFERVNLQFKIANIFVGQGKLNEALTCIEEAMAMSDFHS